LVSAPAGSSLDPSSGVLSWTPTEAQGPSTNLITVKVTDNGVPQASDTKSFTVVVTEANSAPVLSPINNQIAFAGTQLAVTNSTTDGDVPANMLTYSLDAGAPDGAFIDPENGLFTWTPATNQVSGTNAVTVRVTDNGEPSLSNSQSFTIVVVSPPVIESIVATGGNVTIRWSAVSGMKYRVQFKPSLNDPTWSDLPGDATSAGTTAAQTDSMLSETQRSYRVLLVP